MPDINIPIPPNGSGGGMGGGLGGGKKNPKSRLSKVCNLKVGESEFFEGRVAGKLWGCIQMGKVYKRIPEDAAFTTRILDGGTRIWRTA